MFYVVTTINNSFVLKMSSSARKCITQYLIIYSLVIRLMNSKWEVTQLAPLVDRMTC